MGIIGDFASLVQEEPFKVLTHCLFIWMTFQIAKKIFSILRDINVIPQVIGQRRRLGETIENFNDRASEEKWPIFVLSLWLLFYIFIFNIELVVALADFGVDVAAIPFVEIIEKIFCNTCILGTVGLAIVLWFRREDAEIIG